MHIKYTSLVILAATATSLTITEPALGSIHTFDATPGNVAAYSEGGFTYSFSPLGSFPHFGDGATPRVQTLNWHVGGANAAPQTVVLTQDNGLNFNFNSFDLAGLGTFSGVSDILRVTAPSFGAVELTSLGTHTLNFFNVPSVTFEVFNSGSVLAGSVAIDNVAVSSATQSAVPEPTTLLTWAGLACCGALATKRRG